MADIIIYLFTLADMLGIDVAKSVSTKLELSGKKYPVKHFNKNGQDLKYYKKIKSKYRSGGKSK
ncbi:MAG: hypothetical protein NT162_03600, partial [Candidatus Woesebacteria bacterium]|nr:hypothetical protein [Candidatus Woesebacteria bacterium]